MIDINVDVLKDGISSLTLKAFCADDLAVVNAARVSFAKEKKVVDQSDEGLINYLIKHRHTSPLEHTYFRFHSKAPLYVVREWQRHRMASYNEMSGRYAEMLNEFHVPNKFRKRVGKAGHYEYVEAEEKEQIEARKIVKLSSQDAWEDYQALLKQGIAPEHARIVLPLNTYTQFYWSVNAHSLMHFIGLRSHPTAQEEIRVYSDQAFKALEYAMPITAAAFKEHGLGKEYNV